MAYTHLTNVTNYDSLLGAIRNFLNDTGDWTIHQDLIAPDEDQVAPNQALGRQLVVSQGDCLAGLRSTTSGPGANRLYLFDGIPPWSASNLDSMPGNSGIRYAAADIGSASEPNARHLQAAGAGGPFPNVHLFTNSPSTYCHVVVEIQAGRFRHLLFGNLEKYGTWTGGAYYAATYWSQNASVINSPSSLNHSPPFDNGVSSGWVATDRCMTVHYVNGADKWISNSEAVLNSVQRRTMRATGRGGLPVVFKNISQMLVNGWVPLGPVLVQAVQLADNPDTARIIGAAPDFRAVNLTTLTPGDTLTIGSDEWLVFPLVYKNGAAGSESSGVAGVAYLKRP